MTIKSKFLHIFLVVQRCTSKTPGVRRYRVAVISNEDVPEFGPDVPKPAEFDEGDEFKHFLFSKSTPFVILTLICRVISRCLTFPFLVFLSCIVINGENAAYKAPKFREPHVRARQGLIEHLVEAFCNAAVLKSANSSTLSIASAPSSFLKSAPSPPPP